MKGAKLNRLSGRRLTALGAALMALAAAAAVRVALHSPFPAPAGPAAGAPGAAARPMSPGEHVALALAAEGANDVAAALAHYRAAVSLDPRCVDRRSPSWLGAAFEEKLNRWIAGLKGGKAPGRDGALRDASYIFRRMYGGCG